MLCANSAVTAATATTKVRSNSSSSGLAVRCGSSIGRAVIRILNGLDAVGNGVSSSSAAKTRQRGRL
jgi:hypothetical protein